jgi:hypothetical protein
MANELEIKVGDYQLVALEVPNPGNSSAEVKSAFVRYGGMPQGRKGEVFILEIGRYDSAKRNQTAHQTFFSKYEGDVDYRVDTYGRRVVLKLIEATPSKIVFENQTEMPTAVDRD